VNAVLNTAGRYPEANQDNDSLIKQVPYPLHTGPQLAPGEIPSQVISVRSRPALGSEHVTVSYSLAGWRSGRLGIQWKNSRGVNISLDCYPNSGGGLTSAPPGLNQQLTFDCQVPARRDARSDSSENTSITTSFYDASRHPVSDFTTPAVLHYPHSVADSACRWPNGAHETVPVLAPGEVFDATLAGDDCRGRPGTYRINAQAEPINLTARIDTAGDELNLRNNSATRLLKDALRDSSAENLIPLIGSAILTDPPDDDSDCHRYAHIRIDGGPFNDPIHAEMVSDLNTHGSGIAPPGIEVGSSARAIAMPPLVAYCRGVTSRFA